MAGEDQNQGTMGSPSNGVMPESEAMKPFKKKDQVSAVPVKAKKVETETGKVHYLGVYSGLNRKGRTVQQKGMEINLPTL